MNSTEWSATVQQTHDPAFILFAQHGWADTHTTLEKLAQAVAPPDTHIVAPNLGYFNTWIRIESLIHAAEQHALQAFERYPATPIRIIGHSMGGLIWLELLHRHPAWLQRIESCVLIASPVGGAHLARFVDPLHIGIGIARDLSTDRTHMAEAVAAAVPTLVIAGDHKHGDDTTVTVEATRVPGARFVSLPGISHPDLRHHDWVVALIRDFWSTSPPARSADGVDPAELVRLFRSVPGITGAARRDFPRAQVAVLFRNGTTIRSWKNALGVEHVFVADNQGICLYSGFVGWLHRSYLQRMRTIIQHTYTNDILR